VRTSENTCSTTFVNKGEEEGEGKPGDPGGEKQLGKGALVLREQVADNKDFSETQELGEHKKRAGAFSTPAAKRL
jgi:hypothetical protein